MNPNGFQSQVYFVKVHCLLPGLVKNKGTFVPHNHLNLKVIVLWFFEDPGSTLSFSSLYSVQFDIRIIEHLTVTSNCKFVFLSLFGQPQVKDHLTPAHLVFS